MKKIKSILTTLIVVIMASGAIIGTTYALVGSSSTKSAPSHVVKEFYREWLSYPGNPLADKIYQKTSLITPELKGRIDEIVSGFDRGGYDPILCAQDKPEDWAVKSETKDGYQAEVILGENFWGQEKELTIKLRKDAGLWKIDEIICHK